MTSDEETHEEVYEKIFINFISIRDRHSKNQCSVETTFQPNTTSSHTINSSISQNYGSMKNVYITNSGPYIPGNDEIAQAIDSLSARAKQKRVTLTLSLDEMKKCAEQGNAEYQIKLGMIYYEGKDIRKNIVASSKVFQKAAN